MRYEPTFWENGKTPLNDDNLNKIETGLSNLSENVEELNSTVENLSTNTENLSSTVENLSTTMEVNLAEVKEDIEELKNKVDVDITEGSTTTLTNSFDGGLKFKEMLGKSEQKTTKGINLLDLSNAQGGTKNGITITMNKNGSYGYKGTANTTDINAWLLGLWEQSEPLFTLKAGTYYIKGVNLYYNQKTVFRDGRNGGVVTFTEDKPIGGVRAVSAEAGVTYDEIQYPIIALSDKEVEWEPYTGGKPAPNPDYPQEIKICLL